ncbi:hypothetical protein Q4517_10600 [Tenacibaculum sp. 1_MG-2023]|uniref:O-antigen ligase family protein n=1 Tax=Tenacibaculum sp. 1_MG-2023 TaxID=3062653 RepID=UPI0026E124D7|nr:O-antigen ligase family protein [Tenacibaculum sp. 1_MG-2023]MDO6675993.1 hypothetical protein [Tenacibaculum sp. 1_MG-2023]
MVNKISLRFPIELIITLIITLIICRESLLQTFYSSTVFNSGILTLVILLINFTNFSKKVKLLLPLLTFMILSVLLNSVYIEKGGYITFGLSTLSFMLLFINIKRIDIRKLYNYISFIVFLFLFIIYYFYLMGLQVIPSHIFYVLAGPFQNQNQTGMILLCLSAIITSLQRSTKLNHIMLFLLTVSIILTQSRAAMLGVFIILTFYYRKKLILLTPILIILSIQVIRLYADVFERLIHKITTGGSSYRVEFWTEALNNMQNNILTFFFGNGVNVTTVELYGESLSLHSSYVNFIVAYGWLATVFLILLIFYILYEAKKNDNLIFVSLLSLLAHGFFETSLFLGFSICWMSFILMFSLRKLINT